ncbi:chemotaxis protein [Pseudomonas sp. NZIPFR-PS5]|nr:chemotaxis protein [Pseudomonas sp. NZIPFR-PS5]
MRLRDLNLAPRAALFFASIIFLVCVMGVFAILQMGKLRDSEKDVELNWMASIRQTALMNNAALRIRLETQRGLADPQSIEKNIESFAGYRKAFTDAVAGYEPLIASDKERSFYTRVKNSADAYVKQLDILAPLMRKGDIAGAVNLVSNGIRPLTNTMETQIKDLTTFNDEGAEQAGNNATAFYDNGLRLVVGLITAVVILTIGLALLLTKSITNPINDALSVAERIAASDLSREVLVSGTDEAGRLLKALSQMQTNLRATILQISDSSTQLASASEEMTVVTEESSRDEESKRTQGYTEVGLARVAQTLMSIQKLNGNVENTSVQIQGLSERAQSITKVVEVIRAIAEQTNLLALNAAIEAARAGEQGRGFAVVADEVRALAHRTQASTQEIEQMIAAIQNDSDLAVKAMNTSKDLATESLGVAQEASTSLDQISTAISQINERNLMIATASEEQSHVAREVDRNLVSIRELAIQSSAGAAQTATACGEMSKLAVNLNQLVNKFVV